MKITAIKASRVFGPSSPVPISSQASQNVYSSGTECSSSGESDLSNLDVFSACIFCARVEQGNSMYFIALWGVYADFEYRYWDNVYKGVIAVLKSSQMCI